ncbi:MAG TPA: Fic family protein [Caulobacteraceae bacterium]|jgi:cell filamentation protein
MSLEGYDAFDDPNCYPGTTVLKNKAGVRDPAILQDFELEMMTLRAQEPLPAGRFGTAHYRAVHRHLFQDVYGWAGRYRTIRTAKGGNWFCYPENIPGEMEHLFQRLRDPPFTADADQEAFIQSATAFLADLNAIHPFREGNGRAQLAFMHLVAIRAGHPLKLDRVDRKTFLPAMVESFAGHLDGLAHELGTLLD